MSRRSRTLSAVLGLLVLTVVLVGVCFLLGQGILALCGAVQWRWWAPALGYAVLLVIGGQVIRAPNHADAMALAILVAALAAPALPMVRRALRDAGPQALVVTIGLVLLAAIPFFAFGRTGVLGASVSNDMSQHLTAAYFLRTGHGLRPAAAVGGNLIDTGYPLGTHGLASLVDRASGLGEERVFAAITLAIPVLTALAALALVPSARRGARWGLAALVGLGYMPAAYLAQGSFKETAQALLVLASALALGDLAREEPPRGWRRGVPIGLFAAAGVYNYSYGGAFWTIGTAGVLLLIELLRRPRAALSILRRGIVPALGAVLAAAVVLAPEISRIEQFTKSVFGVEPLTNHGNLFHAINPFETLGVWFSGDFRFNPDPTWISTALGAVCLAVLVASAIWWWRRRELVLPAAVIASVALWVDLALTRNTYNAAKGLVVMAPAVMACFGAPLAAAWGELPRRRPRPLLAARALGAALFMAAAVSSLGVLRSAPVGLGPHEQELAAIRQLVYGKPVLFLANDHFAQWELRGSDLYETSVLYITRTLPGHGQKYGGIPNDIDNFESSDLDRLDYVLTSAGAYTSEMPPNFHLVKRTRSYELYRRFGPTPVREPYEPPGVPGAIFDCGTAKAKQYLAQFRWAGVLPTPVVLTGWQGSIGVPGHSARIRVTLPAGRWDVSLQYVSYTSLALRGPGLHQVLAPNFGVIAAYWSAGTVSSAGRAFWLTATSRPRNWFARLLGSPRGAISPDSPGYAPLWHVAFTAHGVKPRRVPARAACGRYVDWFAPAGSDMH
jgi:hypothetical protein